jgi:zinc protease
MPLSKLMPLLLAVLAWSWSLSAAARAQEVENFVLDNGMEVVVIPDRRAPVVTHMVWYKAGSADEPVGQSGIAHFLEHLLFKGTRNHAAGEFGAAVSAIGGNENAFTTADQTAYHQTVSPDALETVMRFEADRMRNLVLTDEVIAPERDVILEERRSRIENSPDALLAEEVQATLFQHHPYRIPVIGWMHEMKELDLKDAQSFYDSFYAPNNAVLVVAGDVDAQAVRALARRTYGAIPRGPDLPPRDRPEEPEQNTARSVSLSDPRVGVPSFSRNWVVPSYTTAESGEAEALDLLSEVLGGGLQSRIHRELVVKQGIAASAGAYFEGTTLDDTSFSVYGAPRGKATLEQVEKAVDAEIRKIQRDGVTSEELERAKTRFVRAMIFARDSASGLANIYGSTLTTGGTVADVAAWPDRIRAVTPEQVRAVAQKYLDPERSVSAYLLPPDAEDPSEAQAAPQAAVPEPPMPTPAAPVDGPADMPAVNEGQ